MLKNIFTFHGCLCTTIVLGGFCRVPLCFFKQTNSVSYRKPLAATLISTAATAVIVFQTQEHQSRENHLHVGKRACKVTQHKVLYLRKAISGSDEGEVSLQVLIHLLYSLYLWLEDFNIRLSHLKGVSRPMPSCNFVLDENLN